MSAKSCSCLQCGRAFFVASPSDWAYRDGSTYYCGWKCIREFDSHIPPHPDTDAPKPGPMSPEELAAFEAENRRISRKLQRQCPVKPSEERREKRVTRPRSTDEEKKQILTECRRLMDEEGLSMAEASRKLYVSLSTMGNWFLRFREELGLEVIPYAARGARRWSTHPEAHRAEPKNPNLSGEKISRILGALTRIHRLLDEIRKEAGISA